MHFFRHDKKSKMEMIMMMAAAGVVIILGTMPDMAVYNQTGAELAMQTGTQMAEEDDKSEAGEVKDEEVKKAYTVEINDYQVALSSKSEVVTLMEKVVNQYDDNNEFQVALNQGNDSDTTYEVVVETAAKARTTEQLTNISFEQNVVVSETTTDQVTVTSVEQAFEDITKESAKKTYYTVQDGDTLWDIANKNGLTVQEILGLNEGMTENDAIHAGDEIVIMVPKSEISVVTTKTITYEEEFNAPVQYVEDNTSYQGVSTVVSAGTAGRKTVTADVTYVDGVETSRNVTQETVIAEAVPQIVGRGTIDPPTYLRPLIGGTFSSGYGQRGSSFHQGVDWYCPIGSSVLAAADGVVTKTSWSSGYGYSIDIEHPDGTMTRYAHLNAFEVAEGDEVTQGQVIAQSGNTGRSTGPHLHFEIWIGGSTVNPLNYIG